MTEEIVLSVTEETLNSLISIGKRINSSLDLDETLSMILEEAKEIIKSEASSLMLIDEHTNELYFNVATGAKGAEVKEIRVPMGKGIAGIVAQTGEALLINDAQNDERIFKNVDQHTQMVTRTILCVPLVTKGKIIGVLEVLNKIGDQGYNKDDRNVLNAFADFAAIAINNRELYNNIQRKAYEASALYQLSQSLNVYTEMDDILRENIAVVCEALEAGRVSIIIKERDEFIFKAGVGIPDEVLKHGKVTVKDNVLANMLANKKGVYCKNVNESTYFPGNKSLRYKSTSFVSAPLFRRDEVIGFVSATERYRRLPYTQHDLYLLEMLAQQISENHNYLVMMEDLKNKEKIETELEIAARMQKDILPNEFPSNGEFDIAACSVPAKKVGGDFYDYIPMGNGRYGIIMSDVSGKGIPAGLFMAISRSVIRVNFLNMEGPSAVLKNANEHIYYDSKTGMFVTSFCCIVDTEANEITYSNAGHFEQYLFRQKSKKIVPLYAKGKPLGVMPNETFIDKSIKYAKGDILLLYTDGITEAMNDRIEQFGEDRLQSLLEEVESHQRSSQIIETILANVREFAGDVEQFDDVTIMCIRL